MIRGREVYLAHQDELIQVAEVFEVVTKVQEF